MIRHAITCLAIASLTFMAPRPAAAAITHTFDTVDAVEMGFVSSNYVLTVTGIRSGQSAPTTVTFTYNLYNNEDEHQSGRCERFALIMMSKPGKFRLAMGAYTSTGGLCRLIRVTP